MPVSDGGAFFASWGGRAHLYEEDEGGGYGYGRRGMEDDAEGAVVGVGLEGMDVRDLDDGEEGQQEEAQDRRRHDHAGAGEEGGAPSWLETVQKLNPLP